MEDKNDLLIGLLYNDSYCGYGFENNVTTEYDKRINNIKTNISHNTNYNINCRTNEILVKMFEDNIKIIQFEKDKGKDIYESSELYKFIKKCRHHNTQIKLSLPDCLKYYFDGISIIYIPQIFKNYYTINEYDGLENVTINYNCFIVENVKIITNNTKLNSDEKMLIISTFLLLIEEIENVFNGHDFEIKYVNDNENDLLKKLEKLMLNQ